MGALPVHADEQQPIAGRAPTRTNARAVGRSFLDQAVESTGSTDQGNVSWVVPAIHPTFNVGAFAINHTEAFTQVAATDAAHKAMIEVGQALAMTGVDVVHGRGPAPADEGGFRGRAAGLRRGGCATTCNRLNGESLERMRDA